MYNYLYIQTNKLRIINGGFGMGVIEELMEKKGEMAIKLLDLLEGKEVKTSMNLEGITLNVGKTKVKLDGEIVFTLSRKSK
jgi:hypothetical protein